MTISGGKNAHYICDLKMEAQIACAHSVVLRAPGLTIDKVGVVSPTLVYDFAAGQGLVAQDLGWQGASAGTFPVACEITSPYFVTPNGLKVKKDTFNITIEEAEPDGWSGQYHGIHWGYGGAYASSWTPGDLRYVYTHPVGPGAYIQCPTEYRNGPIPPNAVDYGGAPMKIIAPNGAITYTGGMNISAPGKYIIYVYDTLRLSSAYGYPNPLTHPTRYLGTIKFNLYIDNIPYPTIAIHRGLVREHQTYSRGIPRNQPFTLDYGELIDSFGLQGLPYTIEYPLDGSIVSNLASPTANNTTASGQYSGENASASVIIRYQKPLGGDENLAIGIIITPT